MSLLIQYLLKLFISLSIIWIFYQMVLRRLTFYNANRWYLLGCTMLSFFIPFINIAPVVNNSGGAETGVARFIPTVQQYTIVLEESTYCPAPVLSTGYDKWDWLFIALAIGILFFLSKFIIRCISFYRMRRHAKLIYSDNVRLYQVDKDIIPFSFGNSIFINQQLHNQSELQEIIRHEFVHVKQKHTHDIIWGELLCILNWYNPFAWLIRNAIRQNLEFIADNKVLENGFDKKEYQYLLLKVIGNRHFSIANQFNFSSLKKRIAMMNKMKSARSHLLKFLILLPLVAILLFAFRTNRKPQDKKREETSKSTHPADAKPGKATNMSACESEVALWISNRENIQKIGDLEKLIGLDGSGDLFRSMWDGKGLRDTIPDELLNDKGYFISIIDKKGSCTVVVWDKNKKEIERMSLNKWDENKAKYESLYGEIYVAPKPSAPPAPPAPVKPAHGLTPPTPPGGQTGEVPPALPSPAPAPTRSPRPVYSAPSVPPAPDAAPKLPENVRHINVHNNKATVTLKNGEKEAYDLSDPKEKAVFDKKYPMPDPPAPPVPGSKNPMPVKVNVDTHVYPAINISVDVDETRKLTTKLTPKLTTNVNTNVNPDLNTSININTDIKIKTLCPEKGCNTYLY